MTRRGPLEARRVATEANEVTMTAILLIVYFIVNSLSQIVAEGGYVTKIIAVGADEIKVVSDGVNETKIITKGNITIDTEGADEITIVKESEERSDERTSADDITNSSKNTVTDRYTPNKANIFQKYGFPKPKDLPILNRKIFKGARVTIREHPYVVSIRRLYSHYLPGTLVSQNLVLTVAHPLYHVSVEELGVVAGENYSDRGTAMNQVVVVVIHEDFDPYTLANDISILRTYDDFFSSTNVKPIKLHSVKPPYLGSQVFVTGWGRCDFTGKELCLPRSNQYYPREVLDPMLRTVTFTVINNSYCEEYEWNEVPLKPGMMCMGVSRYEESMTSCMGVPGAPQVAHGRLTGILSWGIGCGYTFDMPLVYVDLYYYKKWLHHNVEVLSVPKQELSMFYLATKAYVMQKWVNQTLKQSLRKPADGDEHDLQMYDIDLQLARIMGTVYEIRDFVYDGKYHYQKQQLYANIKQSYSHVSAPSSNSSGFKTFPFLSKEKIGNLGFHINHDGTISEMEDY